MQAGDAGGIVISSKAVSGEFRAWTLQRDGDAALMWKADPQTEAFMGSNPKYSPFRASLSYRI
jgi:hypothetical protein